MPFPQFTLRAVSRLATSLAATAMFALLAAPGLPRAADEAGHFMVRGAGRASCSDFLAARAAGGRDYVSLAGWLEGYLTHYNETREGTFDIAPWQDTELLLAAIGNWCERNPAATMHRAAWGLAQDLRRHRLSRRSDIIAARSGDRSVALYSAIVRRIEQRLAQRGHFEAEPDEVFDAATSRALADFQAAQGLEATGLPDQVTLARLL